MGTIIRRFFGENMPEPKPTDKKATLHRLAPQEAGSSPQLKLEPRPLISKPAAVPVMETKSQANIWLDMRRALGLPELKDRTTRDW